MFSLKCNISLKDFCLIIITKNLEVTCLFHFFTAFPGNLIVINSEPLSEACKLPSVVAVLVSKKFSVFFSHFCLMDILVNCDNVSTKETI